MSNTLIERQKAKSELRKKDVERKESLMTIYKDGL